MYIRQDFEERTIFMAMQIIEDYRIISTKQLVRAVKDGMDNSERFCFILGAGASVSSGIPSGTDLEYAWMQEIESTIGLNEIREVAKKLQKENLLENDFEEIERAWIESKISNKPIPSKFYFDIYKLRFFPNRRNGYHYFEKIMAKTNLGFGYYPLALILAADKGNNLIITTNFDSLVEDALFLYTKTKPIVINHELLADYAGDMNIKRPIIAKVHRGIFFDPLNQSEETNELKAEWHDVLASVFQNYTPIVIGYGGGDNSLMALLEDENIQMKNGIYWCYAEDYGLPNEKIQNLIQKKNGYLVRIVDFDIIMFYLGRELFPQELDFSVIAKKLHNQIDLRIVNYAEEYRKLLKIENTDNECSTKICKNQSKLEFSMDKKIIEEQAVISEKKKEQNEMTAWDYLQRGNRHYELKQYDKAIENYTNGINIQPDIAYFYNIRGYTYFKMKNYNEAIANYNKSLELNPEYDAAYNNRGIARAALGEYEMAIADYTEAIKLNPKYKEAYLERAKAYRLIGEFENARADETVAIKL